MRSTFHEALRKRGELATANRGHGLRPRPSHGRQASPTRAGRASDQLFACQIATDAVDVVMVDPLALRELIVVQGQPTILQWLQHLRATPLLAWSGPAA